MKALKTLLIAIAVCLVAYVMYSLYQLVAGLYHSPKEGDHVLVAVNDQNDGWNAARLALNADSTFEYSDATQTEIGQYHLAHDTIVFAQDYLWANRAVLRVDTFNGGQDTFMYFLNEYDALVLEHRYRIIFNKYIPVKYLER